MSDDLLFDPRLTAIAFAGATSKEQAEFFNVFGHTTSRFKNMGADWQYARIMDSIDGGGAKLIKDLYGHLMAFEEAEEERKTKVPQE